MAKMLLEDSRFFLFNLKSIINKMYRFSKCKTLAACKIYNYYYGGQNNRKIEKWKCIYEKKYCVMSWRTLIVNSNRLIKSSYLVKL